MNLATSLKLSTAGMCLLVAAGCGKKEAPAGPGASAPTLAAGEGAAAAVAPAQNATCDSRPENGKCAEYTKSEDAEANKMACGIFKGTWSTTPCPKEQAFASCQMAEKTLFYFKGKSNSGLDVGKDFAEIDCEMVSGKLSLLTPATPAPAPKGTVAAKTPAAKKK